MNFLILSVTAGEGHNSTARALQTELEALGASAQVLDTFDYISPELAKILSEGYLLVTEKAKGAYRLGYSIAENRKAAKSSNIIGRIMADDLAKFINSEPFDAVIFTHPFAGMLIDVMKERHFIKNRTVGILTDFTFHPFWEECTRVDFVVCPDKTLLPQARAKGFSDSQILPLGIPINPKFSVSESKESARLSLGLDPDKTTLLLMGGSMGYGNMSDTVRRIDTLTEFDFQLIAVCGKNSGMKSELDTLAETSSHKIAVLGFVDYVSRLMDASDCIITKPGGLTTSEALAKGLPMIITDPIPGQEERNAEFLLNAGCAVSSSKTYPPEECIYSLLSSPKRLKIMRESVSLIGKPDSTRDLCRFLTDLSAEPVISDYHESDTNKDTAIYLDKNGFVVR